MTSLFRYACNPKYTLVTVYELKCNPLLKINEIVTFRYLIRCHASQVIIIIYVYQLGTGRCTQKRTLNKVFNHSQGNLETTNICSSTINH